MSQAQQRIKKFSRDPSYLARHPGKRVTQTSLAILAVIERYRVVQTSLLLRLIEANERVGYRHLQYLYHTGLVNRFPLFGKTGRPGEFNYFLDDIRALDLLVHEYGVDPGLLDYEAVRRNRQKWKPLASHPIQTTPASFPVGPEDTSEAQRYFVKHELMISRFHGMLERACRRSVGKLALVLWMQGPRLFRFVEAPKLRHEAGGLVESEETEFIPHRPDALFGIEDLETCERRYFFYEAERATNTSTRVIKKLRGHFYYVVRKKQQRQDYGIDRIRAVLIETIDTHWAEHLRMAATNPAVSGPKPSELFWFTSSEFFAQKVEKVVGNRMSHPPYYLENPDIIFGKLWFTPLSESGDLPGSLLD